MAFRLITAYFVIGGLCAAAAVGLFSWSIGPALTVAGLGAMGLDLAALMMRDGSLLARARPLDRWETRGLSWLLASSGALGLAVLVDAVAAGHHRPAGALVALALVVAMGGGVVAVVAMLRG